MYSETDGASKPQSSESLLASEASHLSDGAPQRMRNAEIIASAIREGIAEGVRELTAAVTALLTNVVIEDVVPDQRLGGVKLASRRRIFIVKQKN
jgi:hypothetical protein